jgi:hypothetical protein
MENFDELIRSLEQHNDKPNYIIQKKAADAIEALREEVEEKQNLLNLAIADLAANNDCILREYRLLKPASGREQSRLRRLH